MRKLRKNTKINKGFGLVEMIIMISIITFSVLAIWKIYTVFIKISLSNPASFQSSFLVEEGIEAIKFMRDGGWSSNISNLSTSTVYFLVFDGTNWKATTTPFLINGKFDRHINFFDVFRDSSGNIVSSGSFDSNTKKVSVTVSWQKEAGATTTKIITTYVSNIFNN